MLVVLVMVVTPCEEVGLGCGHGRARRLVGGTLRRWCHVALVDLIRRRRERRDSVIERCTQRQQVQRRKSDGLQILFGGMLSRGCPIGFGAGAYGQAPSMSDGLSPVRRASVGGCVVLGLRQMRVGGDSCFMG